jgi:hypothetical protein
LDRSAEVLFILAAEVLAQVILAESAEVLAAKVAAVLDHRILLLPAALDNNTPEVAAVDHHLVMEVPRPTAEQAVVELL